jgi:hypothetical protein
MEDDQGTEDLFGEDWRSKVQAKGGVSAKIPSQCITERRIETGLEHAVELHAAKSRTIVTP